MDEKNQKKGKSFFSGLEWLTWFIWWKLDNTELGKQVDQYHSLGITKSWRKISALLIAGSILSTIIISATGLVSWVDSTGRVLIYLPIAFFVYRGNKWGILLMMIFWTLEKVISATYIFSSNTIGTGLIITLFWWSLLMKFFYGAFVVENTRKRFDPSINSSEPKTEQKGKIISKLSVVGKPLALIIIAIVILAGWFYWFQYRPTQIKHDCAQKAIKASKNQSIQAINVIYDLCLHDKGL